VKSDPHFPDDENGNVLRRLAARGVDLGSPRVMDFEHRFPDQASAVGFYEAIQETVLEARIIQPDTEDGSGWEAQCRQRMIRTQSAITDTEQRLTAVAGRFGGYPDGSGTLSKPDGSPAE